ncbi:MAG: hypothetical protein IPJ03_02780 [Ignavibacteriales bacterium]|nr:hypothetical protein [Ignavibacteriales bacterium]
MRLKYTLLIISFLLYSQTFAQSIGFNAGYGLLNLKEVNNDLKDTENILSSAGLITSEPDDLNGGLYAER